MFNNQNKFSAIELGQLSTSRLETLTDGVFAIAMTILVLDIHVPDIAASASRGALWSALLLLTPRIISFVVSFVILGMFWVAHHTQFRYIAKLDNKIMWLNIFYLLLVSLLPFTAALLGRYSHNQIAVVIYALHLMLMVLAQYLIGLHVHRNKHLAPADVDPRIHHLVNRVTLVAISAYIAAIGLSFWNINATLILFAVVPLPYIFGWIYRLA